VPLKFGLICTDEVELVEVEAADEFLKKFGLT
jgi:hypothetical protein